MKGNTIVTSYLDEEGAPPEYTNVLSLESTSAVSGPTTRSLYSSTQSAANRAIPITRWPGRARVRPQCAAEGRLGQQAPRAVCSTWSAAGDEGDDYVGGVTVEVLAAPVVDSGRSGVGVAGGDLNVS